MSNPAILRPAREPEASVRETGAWRTLALLSLTTMAEHAVHCNGESAVSFRSQMQRTVEELQGQPEESQILVAAGAVSQALTHFSGQTQRKVDALLHDTEASLRLFFSHLEKLHGEESHPAMAALRETAAAAFRSGDLSGLRDALASQLNDLLVYEEERRGEARELTSCLQDRVTILEQTPIRSIPGALPLPRIASATSEQDACTGLPLRAEAETALHLAIESRVSAYLAIFYVHRMAVTNARFGAAIGNQILLFCAQHLTAHITTQPADRLYRWNGPAFVALLLRDSPDEDVQAEVNRVVSSTLSRVFDTPSRNVYLPIKMAADVFTLENTTYAEAADRIERFILTASGAQGRMADSSKWRRGQPAAALPES